MPRPSPPWDDIFPWMVLNAATAAQAAEHFGVAAATIRPAAKREAEKPGGGRLAGHPAYAPKAGPSAATFRVAPLSELHEDPRNPRSHGENNRATVRSSLERFGQVEALVVERGTGLVIGGNCRLGELLAMGRTEAWVAEVDVHGDDARQLGIILNRSAELAGWDQDVLSGILRDFGDRGVPTASLGWDEEALTAMLNPPGKGSDTPDPGPPPVAPGPAHSKVGEVYELGPHRLICGDCRDPEVVARLLAGRKVNVAFTSPPYASQREYDVTSGFRPIPADEYVEWFADVQSCVRAHLAEDGSWFVNIKEHCEDGQRHLYVKDLTIAHVRRWGWRFVDELCWKHHGYPGEVFDRFHNAWEPIFHYAVSKRCKCRPDAVAYDSDSVIAYESDRREAMTHDANHKSGAIRKPGRAYPRNVIEMSNGASTSIAGHAATFPVGLPEFFIRAYSDPDDAIYDPFMGSGSTLMAAAKNGRVAYGAEISARYCDVIRRRFTTFAREAGIDAGSGALDADGSAPAKNPPPKRRPTPAPVVTPAEAGASVG